MLSGALVATWLCCAPAAAAQLRWMAAESDVNRALATYLADSDIISDLLVLTGRNIALDPELQLSIGASADGSRSPSYAREERRIRLPYAYFEDAIRAQAELGGTASLPGPAGAGPIDAVPGADGATATEGQAVRHALDTLEYTLYHLVAHALLGDGDVEVDDRAEALSAWLMIKGWPNGAAQWVEVSRAFGRLSQRLDGPLEHYWHAHALYGLNERRHACWALGADPVAVEPMLDVVSDPPARRERCRQSWRALDAELRISLQEVLLPDAPLGAPIRAPFSGGPGTPR